MIRSISIVHDLARMSFHTSFHARAAVRTALLAGVALLGACSSFDGGTRSLAEGLTLYRPEVVQGNFVSKEQVQALRPGMSRLQVRDILGTPLVSSVFHADRWDYVFTIRRQGVEPQRLRLTVFFSSDQLERFEGDEMPSETEFVESISRKRKVKVPQLEATEEQLARYPAAADAPAATPGPEPESAAQPLGNYPPLDSGR